MKKILIVGAGPAGLFAAQELIENSDLEVIVIDKNEMVGGSGLRADGKLNFTYKNVGGEDLTNFISEEEADQIINQIKDTFKKHGVHSNPLNSVAVKKLKVKASLADFEFIPVEQAHIGSDKLQKIMEQFYQILKQKGVKFQFKATASVINPEYIVAINRSHPDVIQKIFYDYLLIAGGRTGSLELKEAFDLVGIKYKFNPIDIGIRIEIPAANMADLTDEFWETKLITYTQRNEKVRTFCVAPRGHISLENYGAFNNTKLVGVNGYSNSEGESSNTNFALLNTVHLTKPFTDTTLLGQSIAYQTNILGGGKPIVQRYIDFVRRRRTNEKRIKDIEIKPSIDATPGDITFAYPAKIVENLEEALFKLEDIITLEKKSTLLYAPEIKFYARRIITTKKLETTVPNIFVAGDGSGISRGIIGAAATGIIAARGILQ